MTNPVGSTTMVNPSSTAGSSGSSNSSSATGAAGGASATSSSIGGLTMNDFLTLMTAQLQNQDPLNPTDSNQFLSQLSELSTVEGISQLNTSMTSLSNSMISSQALTAASLVGKGVLAPASSAFYTSGTAMTGAVQVPSGATNVVLSVTNSGGALVDQMNVPASAGSQTFSWNGVGSDGKALPSGTYALAATAQVGGASQAATTLINGTVTSVTLGATGASPTLNTTQLGPVPLSSVQQID
jgi:flagellar basal-body rod modification protein FlgD